VGVLLVREAGRDAARGGARARRSCEEGQEEGGREGTSAGGRRWATQLIKLEWNPHAYRSPVSSEVHGLGDESASRPVRGPT
jgi:hypothetical protein